MEAFSTKEHWKELQTYILAVPHVKIKRLYFDAPLNFAFGHIEMLVQKFDIEELKFSDRWFNMISRYNFQEHMPNVKSLIIAVSINSFLDFTSDQKKVADLFFTGKKDMQNRPIKYPENL